MAIEELLQIPDVGTKIAEDLWNLGIRYVISNDQDPEVLYSRLQAREGVHMLSPKYKCNKSYRIKPIFIIQYTR